MSPLRGDKSSWIGVPADISDIAEAVKNGARMQIRSRDFVVTAKGDLVSMHALLGNEDAFLLGDGAREPIAQYRAPATIGSISCMGQCVCVGLEDSQVCVCPLHLSCACKLFVGQNAEMPSHVLRLCLI